MSLGMELPRKEARICIEETRNSSGGKEKAENAMILDSLAAQSPEPRWKQRSKSAVKIIPQEAQRLNHDAFVNLERGHHKKKRLCARIREKYVVDLADKRPVKDG